MQEAVRHAHTAWTPTSVPESVRELMDDAKCAHLSAESSDFWVGVAALRCFVVRAFGAL
jgi:hypothetical protein